MDDLDVHYKELQGRFDLVDAESYGELVTPNGNALEPVHRWFHLKEAYSHRLLPRILQDLDLLGRSSLSIVDPFVGSGTTALSAHTESVASRVDFQGYEINPYLHLLASTKVAAVQADLEDDLTVLAGKVVRDSLRTRAATADMPALSTFRRPEFFQPEHLDALLKSLAAIDDLARLGVQPLAVDLLRVALAACLEPCSLLRRDGRTLRLVRGKVPEDPHQAFTRRVAVIQEDLAGGASSPLFGSVEHGDIRDAQAPSVPGVDLVLFSPPYPNNIDYTEVYKLEAWFLGLVTTQQEFSLQRRRTLRSHGSLLWDDVYAHDSQALTDLLSPLVAAVPADRYSRSRVQVIRGYADDMMGVLASCSALVRPGGHVVCVVGNSLHGRGDDAYVVASDLLIAQLAGLVGLEVSSIAVARRPRRRRTTSELMRESVVFLRKAPA